jgi:hypothetical protein
MRNGAAFLAGLAGDRSGAMAIEAAFVLPILALICLGGFDVSQMLARNMELQTSLAEAAAIALADTPESQAEAETIEDILEASTGLADANVVLERKFRCGTQATLEGSEAACPSGGAIASYLQITLTDNYDPLWTSFGIGLPVPFSVSRTVQIS